MGHPLELLRDVARDEWSDPVETARSAAQGLLALAHQAHEEWGRQGLRAAYMLREARPDSPLLLAVTQSALASDPAPAAEGLRRALAALDDRTWTAELGLAIAHHPSLGITSLASEVLEVLEAAARLAESTAQLYTDRRAVARGLGYLRLVVEVAPPEEAEALVAVAVAVDGSTIWTTERTADVALAASVRRRRIVPVAHPLARLSPLNRAAFRPSPGIVDVALPEPHP
ncbi:MAG: hypothetical protein M3N51_06985 [Actinomycetota bacterium]|nr:hypothetical protein [Actinomycetota bacterium]